MTPFRFVLNVALLIPLVAAPALAGGSTINPGVDLFATPPGSGTSIGFADDPIPHDFFCPGSPEFTGTIYLMGEPLVTEPPHVAGTADCIVERLDSVPATGGTTALRIRALNLVNEDVLTIDCEGVPRNFGVRVNLDPEAPPPSGSFMDISPNSWFNSHLEVPALLKFYDIDNGYELGPLPHHADLDGSGPWAATPGADAVEIQAPFTVDTDGDAVPDTTLPGTSTDFFVGWNGPIREWVSEAIRRILHRFLPPFPIPIPIIEAGVDLFETPAGSGTKIGFANDPIPADFFCPGSPEFTGTIFLKGEPLTTSPAGVAGSTDCIVERLDTVPADGSTTALQIRALNLTHEQELNIPCNGGSKNFGVKVNLDPQAPPSSASYMEIHENSFNSYLEVPALLHFYEIDTGLRLASLAHQANLSGGGVWSDTGGTDAIVVQGQFAVDTDGDNVPDTTLPGTTGDFFVGWNGAIREFIEEIILEIRHRFRPPFPIPIPIPIIEAGVDLFETPAGSGTKIGFANDPIPAGFFCEGSPEFTGTIFLMGEPLATSPAGVAGSTDCIVERLDTVLADGGTTALQIRALNLTHEQVLPIPCNTGNRNFGVKVSLDPQAPPSTASYMEIHADWFNSYLEVPALLTFYEIDTGFKLQPLPHQANLSGGGPWSPTAGSQAIVVPGQFTVDTDGDGVPDTALAGTTTDFFVGWNGAIREFIEEIILEIRHRFRPPFPIPIPFLVIEAGIDLFETPAGSGTSISFANDPIPAGFFCEGSPEFTGTIFLMGERLATSPTDVAGTADCIVERLDDVPVSGGTTALQIRALNLTHEQELTIDCYGGPKNFGVRVNLDTAAPPSTASYMQIQRGWYNSYLEVPALLKFYEIGTTTELTLAHQADLNGSGFWSAQPSSSTVVDIQDQFTVDTDGDAVPDTMFAGTTADFHVGWIDGRYREWLREIAELIVHQFLPPVPIWATPAPLPLPIPDVSINTGGQY